MRRRIRTPGFDRLESRALLAPVIADPGNQFVEEGNTLTLQVEAFDPAHQAITYGLAPGAPAGSAINPATGLLTWKPPDVQATYAIGITATAGGSIMSRTISVLVFDVAPFVQAGYNAVIPTGTTFTRNGYFTDPNPDTWTAAVDYGDGSGPQPLALGSDKSFQLQHSYQHVGIYSVAVTVNDSQGGQGRGFFAVVVAPESVIAIPVVAHPTHPVVITHPVVVFHPFRHHPPRRHH